MNPWLDPAIPAQMREKADADLQRSDVPIHFRALAAAVRETQCPGSILEVGCGVGHNREVLDRAGVQYASYNGVDANYAAVALARERYPESAWVVGDFSAIKPIKVDIVIDGSCVLHVDDWRAHLANLCAASRRWVILHRLPAGDTTERRETSGYGQRFPAWRFAEADIRDEMGKHGFEFVRAVEADGGSVTATFARPRHYVTYADDAYLSRLKTLYASMVEHCGPFYLHVLAWGDRVYEWAGEVDDVTSYDASKWLQGRHPELQSANLPGPPRTKIEHYWTCGPQWIVDVMDETGEPATYVDADVCFFSSPEPVFAEIGGAPAGVVPHGFARASQGLPGPKAETHEVFGKYNVGIVHVADRSLAELWASMCKAWCYDKLRLGNSDVSGVVFENLYGDQKFVDIWPLKGARVVTHPGACLGPWAAHTRALDVRDGVVYFGGRKLVAYHFSGLRELPDGHSVATRPEYRLSKRQEEILYARYWAALKENR